MKINTNIKTLKRIAKNTAFELAKVYLPYTVLKKGLPVTNFEKAEQAILKSKAYYKFCRLMNVAQKSTKNRRNALASMYFDLQFNKALIKMLED